MTASDKRMKVLVTGAGVLLGQGILKALRRSVLATAWCTREMPRCPRF